MKRNEKFVLGDYKNPPVPEGYKHIYGEWYNGFTIEREADGSRFTWVPVDALKANGTIDGYSFTEKFGRRREHHESNLIFSLREAYEETTILESEDVLYFLWLIHIEGFSGGLVKAYNSYVKYGGQYVSTYPISMNRNTRKPQSISKKEICIREYKAARGIASALAISDSEECHLLYGAEFDNVREWINSTKAECKVDSSLGTETKRYVYNNIHFTEYGEWTQEESLDYDGWDRKMISRGRFEKSFIGDRYEEVKMNAFHAAIYFE